MIRRDRMLRRMRWLAEPRGIVLLAHAIAGARPIRIPAIACRVVELKPSRGRLSRGLEGAEVSVRMAQEFVVGRTVGENMTALLMLSLWD